MALSQYSIIDSDGVSVELEALDTEQATIKLTDGQLVSIPRAALNPHTEGGYRVDFSLRRFLQDGVMVIPVVAEEIDVEKHAVEHVVRVKKLIQSKDVTVDEDLLHEEVNIERVSVNRYVETLPSVREENGITIIPIVEEVLVVEKRLLLREEIHVTRRQSTEKFHEVYTLQSEDVHVERDGDINPV